MATFSQMNAEVWEVYTCGDFHNAILTDKDNCPDIRLMADIDLTGEVPFVHTFTGSIEGNGHTISNFHYTGSNTDASDLNTVALFRFATGATFSNFTITDFSIAVEDGGAYYNNSALVASSNSCTFSNIIMRNTSLGYARGTRALKVAGFVYNSWNDQFTDCTVASSCSFRGHDDNIVIADTETQVGGFVSIGHNSTFTRCHFAGSIWADDDFEGGICAHAIDCTFVGCLNSGTVVGEDKVGGIVGIASNCSISESVNVGIVSGDDPDNDYIGGIVGYIRNNSSGTSSVKYCLGFGQVNNGKVDNSDGIAGYRADDVGYANNHIYYLFNGKTVCDFPLVEGYDYDDLLSGKYAFFAKNAEGKNFLYQSLDNDPFCTKLPVPIPAAGNVYKVVHCDPNKTNNENIAYSNTHSGLNIHTSQDADKWGFCTKCGYVTGTTPQSKIEISTAADLVNLSWGVRLGVDYHSTSFQVKNDIDMASVTGFIPIGLDIDHPFRGIFYGNGHRIKNLKLQRVNESVGTGLFGVVTGATYIQDLIIDSSCTISNGGILGVGGLVGCIMTSSTYPECKLYLTCCGNEATVTGGENTGGLVGGVYDKFHEGKTDNGCELHIFNCYNTGRIFGTKVSAALVGYAHYWIQAENCYNIGTVKGVYENSYLFHYAPAAAQKFSHIYQLSSLPAQGSITTSVSAYDVAMGSFACQLKATSGNASSWGQNLGSDLHPTFTESGIYHERAMTNQWGTAILPFTVQTDAKRQLYQMQSSSIQGDEGYIVLKEAETIDPNTPFFFKKLDKNATSVCFSAPQNEVTLPADNATELTVNTEANGWTMTGTYSDVNELGVYFIATDKIWYAEEPVSVSAYRAFLNHTGNRAPSLSIRVDEDEETSQISEVSIDDLQIFNSGYNLYGMPVKTQTRGIVVNERGQKMIVK